MNRRKFLSLSALFAAPAIVKAESLMKIAAPPQQIWTVDRLPTGIGQADVYVSDFFQIFDVPRTSDVLRREVTLKVGNILHRKRVQVTGVIADTPAQSAELRYQTEKKQLEIVRDQLYIEHCEGPRKGEPWVRDPAEEKARLRAYGAEESLVIDNDGAARTLDDCIEIYGQDRGEQIRKECESLMRKRRRELLRDIERMKARGSWVAGG